MLFQGDSAFFIFSIRMIRAVQEAFYSRFLEFFKKCLPQNKYRTTQARDQKLDLIYLMTLDDVNLACGEIKIGMLLENAPDTIRVDLITFCSFDTVLHYVGVSRISQ